MHDIIVSNQIRSNQIKLMEISENKAISQANVCGDLSRKLMACAFSTMGAVPCCCGCGLCTEYGGVLRTTVRRGVHMSKLVNIRVRSSAIDLTNYFAMPMGFS